jgi:DHA3 family macrolide efflux protein-like MFS transporter
MAVAAPRAMMGPMSEHTLDPPAPEPPWKARFFTIWGGQACSLLGSQVVQFALIWYLTAATGSAAVLAAATFVGTVPQTILSPVIGALVDRWDRRRIMIAADACVALLTLVLAALFATGAVQVWHIYALMLARSIGGAFHQSAMGASVVLMVPKAQLARVQGLTQALYGGMNIVGAPLGALLVTVLPMPGVLAIDVGTALLAIAPLLFIAVPQPPRRAAEGGVRPSLGADMREGLRYVLAWPGLLLALLMVMWINMLFTPFAALQPLLVTRHFGGGAPELALLQAINGAGIIGGGLLLGIWGGFKRRVLTAQLGLVVLGLAVLVIGLAPAEALWMAVGGFALMGLAQPVINGSFGAVIQAGVAPEMQGRVFSLIFTGAMGAAPLGLALAAPVADAFGPQVWFAVGGAVCALLGVVGLLTPAIMGLEASAQERGSAPHESGAPSL